MINSENLEMMCEHILNDKELTTKELNSFGFNSKNLKTLIEEGTLVRIKRGIYTLNSVDKLFCYGKKLIAQKENDKANLCFLKCFELDPLHRATCFQLFLFYIQKKDYDKALEYFNILDNSCNDDFIKKNNNFYLYLLSIITELSENYKEYAKNLKYEDFKLGDDDKSLQNKVRFSAYRQKLFLALKQLNAQIEGKNITTSFVLTKYLINQAIDVQIENRKTVLNFIKQKEYEKVLNFYEILSDRHDLSVLDKAIVTLVNDLLEVKSSKSIPLKKVFKTNNLFKAIKGKNYELALNLVKENNEITIIDNENNSIYLLLKEIIKTCREIKNKSLEEKEFIDINKVLKDSGVNNYSDEAKEFYEFLILNLTKISLIEKDVKFTKPIEIMNLITNKNYSFDIFKYMQEFYTKLSQKKYEEARIYLEIIAKGNKVYGGNVATEGLLQILEFSEKTLYSKEENKNNNSVEKKTFEKEETINKEKNFEREFLDKKYEELLVNNGIVLLKPMNDDRIENILKLMSSYKEVDAFVIEYEGKKQIVLRYRPINATDVDGKELIQLGNTAYQNNDYKECIKYYLKVLPIYDEPSSYIYSKLGLAYMRNGDNSLAIDYFIIASAKSKEEGKNYDYSDLVLILKGEIPEENIKPRFRMTEEELDYSDVFDYYGIENFEEINNYIIESGLDVESACIELGLTCEQIDIIKLIYAKKFYTKANYSKGDLFLKSFEESQNKTKKTKKLFEEIRKNKRFYQNRDTNTDNQLVLTLIPKKKNNA